MLSKLKLLWNTSKNIEYLTVEEKAGLVDQLLKEEKMMKEIHQYEIKMYEAYNVITDIKLPRCHADFKESDINLLVKLSNTISNYFKARNECKSIYQKYNKKWDK